MIEEARQLGFMRMQETALPPGVPQAWGPHVGASCLDLPHHAHKPLPGFSRCCMIYLALRRCSQFGFGHAAVDDINAHPANSLGNLGPGSSPGLNPGSNHGRSPGRKSHQPGRGLLKVHRLCPQSYITSWSSVGPSAPQVMGVITNLLASRTTGRILS